MVVSLSAITMEPWFIFMVSLCLSLFIKSLIHLLFPSTKTLPLPPGPLRLPIIGSYLFLRKSFFLNQSLLRNLHAKYGPIITLTMGPRPFIFIADPSLAHSALIQNGAVFSNRPKYPITSKTLNSNQRDISSAFYGPTWRLLRRNLTSEMLHPTRIRSFSGTRKWVLHVLMDRLKADSESGNSNIKVIDHLQYAMFSLLVFMCFGDKLDEKEIKDVECVVRKVLLSFNRFRVLNFWPSITRVLFNKRWKELMQIKKERDAVLIPLIRARERLKKSQNDNEFIVSYVDTLLELEWPEEKRKLDEYEIVTLCSEFLTGGADTTTTALEWIMANLVKYPHIQQRVFEEIREVMDDDDKEVVKEEDLSKLQYLKAVILEGLRRHPPAHFVVPHAVSEDLVLNGYLVPKNASINFMVADMGWDSKLWENPMEFKPERFLKDEEAFDITGSREIRMMPFGAGRRICPGHNLAMHHLEYFVANLVRNFEWKAANGDVDLSENQTIPVSMKNPLHVSLSPRI